MSTALAVLFLLSYQIIPCLGDAVAVLTVKGMTVEADVILLGTVEEILHYTASPYTVPFTHRLVTVSVERYLKNPIKSKTITVVALGATIGSSDMWHEDRSDMRHVDQLEFQESERVLLFLWDDPEFLDDNPQGLYQVVGTVRGKFTVGSDSARSNSGQVIEDGLKIGEIEFNLGERSMFDNLVFPIAITLLGFGVVFLFYRSRFSR